MNFFQRTRGSALIELSLIVPIFIVMMLGSLDIGMLLRNYIAATDSARAGVEYALVHGHEADMSGWAATATYAAGTVPGYTVTPRLFCTCGAGGATVSCGGMCAGMTIAQYAEVTVTATLPLIYPIRGLSGTIPIQSVARIRTRFTAGM